MRPSMLGVVCRLLLVHSPPFSTLPRKADPHGCGLGLPWPLASNWDQPMGGTIRRSEGKGRVRSGFYPTAHFLLGLHRLDTPSPEDHSSSPAAHSSSYSVNSQGSVSAPSSHSFRLRAVRQPTILVSFNCAQTFVISPFSWFTLRSMPSVSTGTLTHTPGNARSDWLNMTPCSHFVLV